MNALQIIIIAVVFAAALLTGFYIILKKLTPKKEEEKDDQSLVLLQNQLQEITRTLDAKLGESTKAMQSQFGESHKIFNNVTQELTRLGESHKRVETFADQLQKLQDILKNPKQRGILGEYYLETLLKNAFQPKQYQMQYKFKDGEIVDAVLFVGEKIIPIDSKFSLENYNRIVEEEDHTRREELEKLFKQDLKNRIDETSKYIRPQEGTTDFAFMFIPAEGIFYDLLVNQVGAIKVNTRDLIDYATKEKNVHIVSPTTFYVTLQAMWQGMRSYQIQESTKDILKNVEGLRRHLIAYEDYMRKVGGHLGTTVNAHNAASKEFKKIDKDVLKLTGEGTDFEPELIDKPQGDDE
ncbi:DNA recombination protein RmuC [bacterium]|nr:DNA recombination protein RmuC [bacterium]|tara:strand:- start:1628 stop:2683 length:1056 start_codon:yes stop_codon:yes gene_type:complete